MTQTTTLATAPMVTPSPDAAPETTPALPTRLLRPKAVARLAVTMLVAGGGIWYAMTGVAGIHWADVWQVLAMVNPVRLVVLAVIWALGLGIYSIVLAAAMPGLGMRRGLLLNLSGSAVANVMPLGGALATALNWRMLRSWGHTNAAFVAFSVLTNALDVATKLMLPLVAVAALMLVSAHVPTLLWVAALICAAVILGAVALHLGLSRRPVGTNAPSGSRRARLVAMASESGGRIRDLVRHGWSRLLPASAAYIVAQVILFAYALEAVGVEVSLPAVLAAAAIERLGTVAPLTPGGAGVAEVGTIAFLVATGFDPASVVAGVLLYRGFLILMEIPVGGVLLGGWVWMHRVGRQRQAAGLLT